MFNHPQIGCAELLVLLGLKSIQSKLQHFLLYGNAWTLIINTEDHIWDCQYILKWLVSNWL